MLRRAFLLASLAPVLNSQPDMFGDAEAYERFMGRWSRLVAPRLVDFTGLPEQGRMLDAGSGTGSLANAIAGRKARARVVGIDLSKEYVAYASSRNPSPDRVGFEVGDAQQLHFPDSSFEAALSLLVFNFIPDPKKALSEIRRVTRPGGKLSAAVWDYGAGMRMLRVFWDAAASMDPGAERLDEKHMPLCRAGELSALWSQGGLTNVRERSINISMRFESSQTIGIHSFSGRGQPAHTSVVLIASICRPYARRSNAASLYRAKTYPSLFLRASGQCAASFQITADSAAFKF